MTPPSDMGKAPAQPVARRRISLRVFLSLLMLVLSLITVGGTAAVAYWLSYDSLTELKEDEFEITNRATANEIGRLLDDPAQRILSEFTHRAQIGMFPLSDPLPLGKELAERLRVRPHLAWISYSNATTGDFTGAWRDKDKSIVLNHSSPSVNGGLPVEYVVGLDGKLTPYQPDKPRATYDPRKTHWFAESLKSDDTVWSAPYRFADGNFGITASRAWRSESSLP